MAETIRNKKEEKKTKAEAPGLMKKDKKHQTSFLCNQCRGGSDILTVKIWSRSNSCKNFSFAQAVVTEIINLRHLEWFQLASDVSNQRAQHYATVQKFSRNYVER